MSAAGKLRVAAALLRAEHGKRRRRAETQAHRSAELLALMLPRLGYDVTRTAYSDDGGWHVEVTVHPLGAERARLEDACRMLATVRLRPVDGATLAVSGSGDDGSRLAVALLRQQGGGQ